MLTRGGRNQVVMAHHLDHRRATSRITTDKLWVSAVMTGWLVLSRVNSTAVLTLSSRIVGFNAHTRVHVRYRWSSCLKRGVKT